MNKEKRQTEFGGSFVNGKRVCWPRDCRTDNLGGNKQNLGCVRSWRASSNGRQMSFLGPGVFVV